MEATEYKELGTGWQSEKAIECCVQDPPGGSSGCDCCYDTWVKELKTVKQDYSRVSEEAAQLTEQYKFTAAERDKLKSWLDDLLKTDQLSKSLCDQFKVMVSQTDKICTNSEKSVDSIEILFCMIRDLYEQVDLVITTWTDIDNCIKCINSDELPADSGIRKCLKIYYDKVDAVLKTRAELIKAIMSVIKQAYWLHEEICSDFGLHEVVSEWHSLLNCDEKCGNSKPPADPCKEQGKGTEDVLSKCRLRPILTLPICNDAHYSWVETKYDEDVKTANDLADQLVELNKKKEALSACKTSLETAIKEVDPKELCK